MLVFSKGWFDGRRIDLFALLMALAIVVDYGAWLRLMLSGRTFVSMWRPLWLIAIPLAVFSGPRRATSRDRADPDRASVAGSVTITAPTPKRSISCAASATSRSGFAPAPCRERPDVHGLVLLCGVGRTVAPIPIVRTDGRIDSGRRCRSPRPTPRDRGKYRPS